MFPSEKPSYIFKYFAVPGIGEATRLLLTAAKVNWVEENPEWPQEKPNQPFGRLPVLIEKGTGDGPDFVICESAAIERYVARKYGLMPGEPKEASRQEQLREQIFDIVNISYAAAKGAEGFKARFDELLAKLKEVLAMELKNNGSNGHFTGDKLTYIDIIIYSFFKFFIFNLKAYAPEYVDVVVGLATPDVVKLILAVKADPCLQSRVANDDQYFPFLA
ncbi:hypothetical protein BX070DRAFT_228840 [Coemansia spiralis]|nr:hypothetical protein BX070DRAFT_228840 [Coemansia spiralis]